MRVFLCLKKPKINHLTSFFCLFWCVETLAWFHKGQGKEVMLKDVILNYYLAIMSGWFLV